MVLEERLAALDGGAAALALSSGSIKLISEFSWKIFGYLEISGGTWNLFANTFKNLGIEVRFADPSDPENFRKLTDDKTRAYFGETLPNPKLNLFPIEEVANIGRPLGIPLIVDNTAGPINIRPFDHGAAIITYSLTKWIGGHGTSIGGAIVDGANFDWTAVPERQPLLNEPDGSYHGVEWATAIPQMFGAQLAFVIRARVVVLRDQGGAITPTNSFNFIQGLETLPLRLKQHNENAIQVAEFLKSHKAVSKVIFPKFHEGENKKRTEQKKMVLVL